MERLIDIHWNGFIKQACDNYPEESCAFLFAKKPFGLNEEWFVFPVDNDFDGDKKEGWKPNKKQLLKVKKKAKEMKLTKIGNIHSHPLRATPIEDNIEYMRYPSSIDLKYAKRHNDIIRGILVVEKTRVLAHLFHDQFGEPIDLYLNGLNSREIELDVR